MGVIIGPVLGGRVVDVFGSPSAAFALGTLLGVSQLVMTYVVLPETSPPRLMDDGTSYKGRSSLCGYGDSVCYPHDGGTVEIGSDDIGGRTGGRTADGSGDDDGGGSPDGGGSGGHGPLGMLRLFTSSRAMALLAGSTALQCMTENKSILDLCTSFAVTDVGWSSSTISRFIAMFGTCWVAGTLGGSLPFCTISIMVPCLRTSHILATTFRYNVNTLKVWPL